MAVTDEKKFDENKAYTVAVPKEKYALKQHLAFSYPEWKLVDCDSLDDAADMVIHEKQTVSSREQVRHCYMMAIEISRAFHLQEPWRHALR